MFHFGNRDLGSNALTTVDPIDPFSGDPIFDDVLGRFWGNMDRATNDFWSNWKTSMNIAGSDSTGTTYTPDVDVRDVNNEIVVHADVPGITKENVNVDFRDGNLIISGENRKDDEYDTTIGHIRERRYGRFMRSIPLPNKVDPEKTQAKIDENGVLEVRIPRTDEPIGRRITVQ